MARVTILSIKSYLRFNLAFTTINKINIQITTVLLTKILPHYFRKNLSHCHTTCNHCHTPQNLPHSKVPHYSIPTLQRFCHTATLRKNGLSSEAEGRVDPISVQSSMRLKAENFTRASELKNDEAESRGGLPFTSIFNMSTFRKNRLQREFNQLLVSNVKNISIEDKIKIYHFLYIYIIIHGLQGSVKIFEHFVGNGRRFSKI